MEHNQPVGRFAPSPTGRMHLGNIYTALLSWLSAKAAGGRWILRIEDLDPQRSRREYAELIEDDLHWLGLDWDEGGLEGRGPHGPYCQSQRGEFYHNALETLRQAGLTYRCRCRRADLLATQAPHQSDGHVVYSGRCRPRRLGGPLEEEYGDDGRGSVRLFVPDRDWHFTDRICGEVSGNLARDCGDFIVKRSDGAWAYQLAVVVDDALMGVTEVVRGNDLLLSTGQQLYLYELLGWQAPEYAHLPLIVNEQGVRLSKRDAAMSMAELRKRYTPEELIGELAYRAHLLDQPHPTTPAALLPHFHGFATTK